MNIFERLKYAAKSAAFGFSIGQQAEEYYRKFPQLRALLGMGVETDSGIPISERTALNCSVVWACVRVIADTVASLPFHVMQDTDTSKRVASEHPLDWLLYRVPNPEMSALRMRQRMTAECLLWGNSYARRVRRGGTGQTIGLWPIEPDRVTPKRVGEEIVYDVTNARGATEPVSPIDIFHLAGLGFDGLKGQSVVSLARNSIGLAQIQEKFVSKFFASGARKPYILEKPTRFKTDTDFDKFREGWEKTYAGADNFHKAPILEGDIKLRELGMSLDDAQFLGSRQFSVPDICRWFRVQPHLVGDLSRSTNNNIEEQGREFITQTLMYWLCLWEQEGERQLLTPGEQGRYYLKHNANALLRGNFASRMSGYSIGLQNGFLNPDRVCSLEDWEPLPNGAGQAYHIQLNMQTLPGTGQPTTAEQSALAKLQQGGQSNAA